MELMRQNIRDVFFDIVCSTETTGGRIHEICMVREQAFNSFRIILVPVVVASASSFRTSEGVWSESRAVGKGLGTRIVVPGKVER